MRLVIWLLAFLALWIGPCVDASVPREQETDPKRLTDIRIHGSIDPISGAFCEEQCDLLSPGGQSLVIQRVYGAADETGWKLAEGWTLKLDPDFDCLYDSQGTLAEIRLLAPDKIQVLNRILVRRLPQGDGPSDLLLEAGDGTSCRYQFERTEQGALLLKRVELSDGRALSYSYRRDPATGDYLVTRREDRDGHFLINEYEEGSRRVARQLAPVGVDETPIPVARLAYGPDYIEVRDALGQRMVYRHLRSGRLSAIETYANDQLYRTERFSWSEERLISYAILDETHQAVLCRTFDYDARGHLIRKILHGDHSGQGPVHFDLDANGGPLDGAIESYSIYYSYSDDDLGLLLAVREDNGKLATFAYDSQTQRLTGKFLWEGALIRQRLFCRYNDLGQLIETIADDGHSVCSDDLSGVTERKMTWRSLKTQLPGLGLPVLVDEKYYDPQSGAERLLSTVLNSYDALGRLARQDTFDGESKSTGYTEFAYDQQGRLASTSDAAGNTQIYHYDPHGTRYEANDSKGDHKGITTRRYDFAGRLIAKEMQGEGDHYTSSFRYDVVGHLTAAIDLYGNETLYDYDASGRCTAKLYPAVVGPTGEVEKPVERTEVKGRVSAVTDASGYTTVTAYNVRGQPTRIDHPDGTYETFCYHLDGTQRSQRARSGVVTLNTHDLFSRVTEKRVVAPDGESTSVQAIYDSFHLVSATDPRGVQMLYSYDGAGRIASRRCCWGEGEARSEFTYDAVGELSESKDWFGTGAQDYTTTWLDRDASTGRVTRRVSDADRQELVTSALKPPPASTATEHYDTQFVNELSQRVLRKTDIDSHGGQTVTTFDALGRIVRIEQRDPLGKPISQRRHIYDLVGNRVCDEAAVLTEGQGDQVYRVEKLYGPMNRLERISEALGTECESIYAYGYDSLGQMDRVTKPDGLVLSYSYDGFGRVRELLSSDGSVAYQYQYDETHNPTEVVDLTTGMTTQRRYDAFNRVVAEDLANGLSLTKERDGKGRLTQIRLPDGSAVDYIYDAALLRAIERRAADGSVSYTHRYTRYSTAGDLEEVALAGDVGKVAYEKDAKGRRTAVRSDFWSEVIPETGYDEAGNITQIDLSDPSGKYRMRFAYDGAGHLVGEGGLGMQSYTYDSLRNRRSQGQSQYEINAANQLVATSTATYSYDGRGNRIQKWGVEGTISYRYDALDRLIAAELPEQWRTEFQYDAFHRRMSKLSFDWSVEERRWLMAGEKLYLYDGKCELGAADAAGTICELRVLGPGLAGEAGAAVALEIGQKVYAPIHDHRGSVSCLVDIKSRKVAEYYRTSAFGTEEIYAADGKRLESADALNPWRFSSKRCDVETGLIYYGRRYYDPEIGRWLTKDPLGDVDGLNDYTFVRNNPLALIDAEGLFSLEAAWDDFSSTTWSYLQAVTSLAGKLVELFQRDIRLFTDIRDDMRFVGNQLIGPRIWDVIGFYAADPESGVVGHGELSDKIRFSHINGIQVTRADSLATVEMISRLHGGINIHYTYRPTAGWTWDLINSVLVKIGFLSPTASLLGGDWKKLIQEMGGPDGGGTIIHYAHSLGGAETDCARHLLTPEEQRMIRVFTFGSPTLMHSEGFQSVTNYVSRLDIVSLCDPFRYIVGFITPDTNITFVGSYWGVPFLDHLLVSSAYRQVLEELGRNFTQRART